MYIVLCADNNYAPFLGVAIYSILKSNFESKEAYDEIIHFYILDSSISQDNKLRIEQIVDTYGARIKFLPTKDIHTYLEQNINAPVRSLSTWYRLFLCSIIPGYVDKLIYMDCDSYVGQSLKDLWAIDIDGFDIAGVNDVIPLENKLKVGLTEDDLYFNAGMLVINIKQWRSNSLEQKMLDFVNSHNGNVCYHDQGTINGVCLKKKAIHPKWNAITPILVMTRKQILDYHQINDYYSEEELTEARNFPAFVHLVPFLTDRPWIKGNFHPLRKEYNALMDETPWKGTRVNTPSKVLEPWVKWMFYLLPYSAFIILLRTMQKFKPRSWFRSLIVSFPRR